MELRKGDDLFMDNKYVDVDSSELIEILQGELLKRIGNKRISKKLLTKPNKEVII